jgi:hypothetical protein
MRSTRSLLPSLTRSNVTAGGRLMARCPPQRGRQSGPGPAGLLCAVGSGRGRRSVDSPPSPPTRGTGDCRRSTSAPRVIASGAIRSSRPGTSPCSWEQASKLGAEGFRIAARHWLAAAEDATGGSEVTEPAVAASRLHASRGLDGWLRVDGLFAPHDADLLEVALDAGVDGALRAARDGDPSVEGRPVSALRAGALVDLAAQALRHEPSDASVPDRYRVAVVVRPGEATVPGEAVCDAAAYRAVLGAASEVLDVGRQTSRCPVGIRRAITLRDRGCVFPGCDRPPSWSDVHHCTPWGEGGRTSVDNGALLCRRHHSFIHRERWQITIDGGRPTTRRPDGTQHLIERWVSEGRAA